MSYAGRRLQPRRLLRVRSRLRAGFLQLLFAAAGVVVALVLSQVHGGPSVDGARMAQLLFTLGFGVVGVVTIVFSLLFGVVQWSASAFSPRLQLFRSDPLVWLTFAFSIGSFVFSVAAGFAAGRAGRVSSLVPFTAVMAVLITLALIRALQTRAYRSLQLAQVLTELTTRGRAVIEQVYPVRSEVADEEAGTASVQPARHVVYWQGPSGVLQQLDIRHVLDAAVAAEALVTFRIGVGEFLYEGSALADVHGGDVAAGVIRGAVVSGAERAFDQDPMLALRLLADIALRGMSSAVNDPATAVDVIDATEALLRVLAVRELAVSDLVDGNGEPRVRLLMPSWEDYLRTAVEDLLPAAAPIPMVLSRLQRLLDNLAGLSRPSRRPPLVRLSQQVRELAAVARPANGLRS